MSFAAYNPRSLIKRDAGLVQELIMGAAKCIASHQQYGEPQNFKFPIEWSTNNLREVIDNRLFTENKKKIFVNSTFPKIVNLAKEIGKVNHLGDLTAGNSVVIKRIDVACILANAFLCTFKDGSNINFTRLYNSATARNPGVQKEKLLCLIHYFETVLDDKFARGHENVYFQKAHIDNFNIVGFYSRKLHNLRFEKGSIFDADQSSAQVIFSNKNLGGGVLGNGCLQEEICFLTCPELLVLKILCPEPLAYNEVVIVKDALQFVKISGYAENMKFERAIQKEIGPILLMDAFDFSTDPSVQWTQKYVSREIMKAFVGFSKVGTRKLASGFWGCGAFKGDPWLKLAIQWIAASAASKELVIHHVGDRVDAQQIFNELQKFEGKPIEHLARIIKDKPNTVLATAKRHAPLVYRKFY